MEEFQEAHDEEQAHVGLLHEYTRSLLKESADEQILKTSDTQRPKNQPISRKDPATPPAQTNPQRFSKTGIVSLRI